MTTQSIRICSLLFFLAFLAKPSVLFADGWNWMPFSKASPSRDSSPLYPSNPSASKSWLPSMKMPKMPWSKSNPPVSSYQTSQKSTWDKMSATSKRWWNKTTAALDPYPDPKPPTYIPPSDAKKPKTSWLPAVFRKQEPNEPRSVDELLNAPRLK